MYWKTHLFGRTQVFSLSVYLSTFCWMSIQLLTNQSEKSIGVVTSTCVLRDSVDPNLWIKKRRSFVPWVSLRPSRHRDSYTPDTRWIQMGRRVKSVLLLRLNIGLVPSRRTPRFRFWALSSFNHAPFRLNKPLGRLTLLPSDDRISW